MIRIKRFQSEKSKIPSLRRLYGIDFMVHIGNDWDELLAPQFKTEYYRNLRAFLTYEYAHFPIHPGMYDIFNAFKATAMKDVRAVILGQDPYHGVDQAHGMCFSVRRGVPVPPSLQNIFKEIRSDLNEHGTPFAGNAAPHGNLEKWAESGVLLLNTVLTVREGAANSHRGQGWETFTSEVIKLLDAREQPIVFLLWGAPARSKKVLLSNKNHLVLEAAHPSPLSAYNGFFGCRHFSKTNSFLTANGAEPIDWRIEY